MLLQIDTRQKKNHHRAKEEWFAMNGIDTVPGKLLVGDYAIASKMNVVVDTKANISELYSNLIQQHTRFRNECVLAQKAGIKLYILVENTDGVACANDVKHWKNPQMIQYFRKCKLASLKGIAKPKPPATNIQLIKIMHSMNKSYGVEFVFCKPQDAGREVVKLLTEYEE